MANQPTKYSKFLVGAASAALVASAVAPVVSAADFSDVKGNTHEEGINALADAGIIKGYEDGSFKPNKTLTRSDVVKMMGKWLVTEGASIPEDARTNPRFSDLTTSSNGELLDYAAVVKDAGVFIGSNGRLLAADNITRENMALVLVRAFDQVNEIDLVTYVNGQDFKADVTDLSSAKTEAQAAINVLDFFDITNPAAPNFNPKGSTTRGHFATFLNKSINTDFSVVAGTVSGSVKVINATTVEVTLDEAVENLNSLNFTIEGLTVSNAAVKQTDKKVVVLTTAIQEGGKKYEVKMNNAVVGSFEGISAVLPTKIDITTQAVQGKVGAQAILTADVGVKQAGIPVTFNVKAQTTTTLNQDQVFEAVTNEEGIATFSYTQYNAGNDQVVAYPTGAPAVRSLGYVFWGVDTILAIEEVLTDKVVNNGANKTYKVTHKDPRTGKAVANATFNVSFVENLNVSADKLANASVNGVAVAQINNKTAPVTATITTDSKGEATFTVSGTNTEVTPVVFAQNVSSAAANSDVRKAELATYEASLLQAQSTKVQFAALQAEYTIELTRDGGEVAATKETNGRKYNVVVKDKDGKLAKNEVVNVALNEDLDRVISTVTEAKFVKTGDNPRYYADNKEADGNSAKKITVKTNDKGEASFVIGSDKVNDYATPVAWIDVNTPNAVEGNLDEGEPKTVAAISYFVEAYLDGSALKSYKGTKTASEFRGDETATFKASLVNQSGKDVAGTSIKKVSYTIFNEGANDVLVGSQVISPNRSYTVSYEAKDRNTDLLVSLAQDKTGKVRVIATGIAIDTDGKDYAFTAKEATASFTATKAVSDLYTGKVVSFNSDKGELTFDGKDAVKYTGADYRGLGNTPIATASDFIKELVKGQVTVTREVKDGKTTFYIIEQNVGVAGPQDEYKGETTLTGKTVEQSIVVGGEALTLTATDLAESNATISLAGDAVSSDATVATAVVADNKLVITAAAAGEATVTVTVNAGTKTAVATVKVTVTEEEIPTPGEDTLASLPVDSFSIIDDTDFGKWTVSLFADKLPESLQGATGYSIVVEGTTYELKKNPFATEATFTLAIDSEKHTKAAIEAGVVTKN